MHNRNQGSISAQINKGNQRWDFTASDCVVTNNTAQHQYQITGQCYPVEGVGEPDYDLTRISLWLPHGVSSGEFLLTPEGETRHGVKMFYSRKKGSYSSAMTAFNGMLHLEHDGVLLRGAFTFNALRGEENEYYVHHGLLEVALPA